MLYALCIWRRVTLTLFTIPGIWIHYLKAQKCFGGLLKKQKLPITPAILLHIFGLVDLSSPLDVTFWACCLVAFFSFFRKSNLLVKAITSFDPSIHLCRKDALFSVDGVSLTVPYSTNNVFYTFLYLASPVHLCA